jgi:hypothetical protein
MRALMAHGGGGGDEIGHEADFQAAARDHAAEDQGPDAHDAAAHFVRGRSIAVTVFNVEETTRRKLSDPQKGCYT